MVTQRVAWSSVAACPLDKPTEPNRAHRSKDRNGHELRLSLTFGSYGSRRTCAEEGW